MDGGRAGEIAGIGDDEADQGGSPGVLTWEFEELQAGNRADAPG